MSLPGFAVRRPVTVVMIFTAVILFGLFSLSRLPIDLYPDIELPTVTVVTTYPGASATDVEEKITELVEGQVSIVSGIKQVRSTSKENMSAVTCEFHYGTDIDGAAADIRSQLEFVRSQLPADADDPMVMKINTAMFPVVMLGVYRESGDVYADFDLVDELIIDRLKSVDGVGSVTVFNPTPQRLEIRLDRRRLELLGLTSQDVEQAIQGTNVNAPAGSLDVGITDYSLALKGEFSSMEELRGMAVGVSPEGGLVYLRDVAEVLTAYPVLEERVLTNDRPSLFMMVNKRSGANTVAVADTVKEALAGIQGQLPPGLEAEVVYDLSTFIVSMIDNLTQTVWLGGLFVILVVLLFLRRLRSALIVAVTIPASLIGAFGGLALFGYTINMFSLMSMAVAIGMVVDNAIVVLENISRHREEGKDRETAARDGGSQVAGAVLASTLTSVSIFGPLVFISGFVGVLFNQLAFVVVIVLIASLAASLLLTPALARWLLRVQPVVAGRQQTRAKPGLWLRVETRYGRTVHRALNHPWLVVIGAVGLLVATFLMAGQLGSGFMPKQDVGDINIALECPVGTTTDETWRVTHQVLELVKEEFGEWITLTYARAGSSSSGMGAAIGQREGPHIGEIGVHMVPVDERPMTTHQMADIIRPRLAEIPELSRFAVSTDSPLNQIFAGGAKPLTIRLKGPNLEVLSESARRVKEVVAGVDGTVDVAAVIPETRPEIQVTLDRLRASRLGVPIGMAAGALRTAFYGSEIGTYRSDGKELDLYLQYREEDRSRLEDLLEVPIRSATGQSMRLSNLGTIQEGVTPIEILRVDQQRTTTVEGDVAGRAMGEVSAEITEKLRSLELGAGVTWEFGGDIQEQAKTGQEFMLVLLMGVVLVYMVMAGQFESFLDPLVIMMSVPFAFTGGLLFLLLTGTDLVVPAFMGLIMLVGIVVNNAIVLLDYVKQLRQRGMTRDKAIVLGGQRRLRPVIMTTLTTICGMLPMAVAGGEGHEMWRPMGIAVIGGLSLSTLVTLFLMPVIYSMADRLRGADPALALPPELDETNPGLDGGAA